MNNGFEMRLYFLFTLSIKLRAKVWYSSFTSLRIIGSLFLAHYILMKVTDETNTKNIQLDQINVQSIKLYFKQFCFIVSLMAALIWTNSMFRKLVRCIISNSLFSTKYEINSSIKDLIKENCHWDSDFLEFID